MDAAASRDSDPPGSPIDPVDTAILAVAEDRLGGFLRHPFAEIAARTQLPEAVVLDRVRAMLEAGTVRRVRQTLITTNLADGALVAWEIPSDRLDAAFDTLGTLDPFTGHRVIRSSAPGSPGEAFRLWTTVKVPPGFSLAAHLAYLGAHLKARQWIPLRTRAIFRLGVGHTRRQGMAPGTRAAAPVSSEVPFRVSLSADEWEVVEALSRPLDLDEITHAPWDARAAALGCSADAFCDVATGLETRGVIGRFAAFVEYRDAGTHRPAGASGLFGWAPAPEEAMRAGAEIGRHEILTHAYLRDASPALGGMSLFAVAHAPDRATVQAHKDAIDAHLAACGVTIRATSVHWSERSVVGPSAITPQAYRVWLADRGLDSASMRG